MKINEAYKSYIKSLPCAVCGTMGVDPHHLEALGMGGKNKSGIKDFSCVPTCRKHHAELEQIGLGKFEKKYEINLWKEAFLLLRQFTLSIKAITSFGNVMTGEWGYPK